jgi:hypothetical protein
MQSEASLRLKVEKFQRLGSDIPPSQKNCLKNQNTKAQKAPPNF